jgi:Fe-S oxidoreductase
VYHYTELLADLAAQGRLPLGRGLAGTRVTYHDPCHLARYNGVTDAPRELIAATGAELVEMPRHGPTRSAAAPAAVGSGGTEPGTGERPSEQRIREAQALGDLDYFVVTCPKDLTMYTAAAVAVGAVGFEVVELTTLLERSVASTA